MDLSKFSNLSIQDLLAKAEGYDKKREQHKKNMHKYYHNHIEDNRKRAAILSKKAYWRKKGFEINDLGEKVKIETA